MNSPQIKKVPLRKCVITNKQLPKKEMFRIVRIQSGEVLVDDTGKVRGHGVYLSKDKDVIKKAKLKHSLNHYLEVNVPDDIYDELLKRLDNNE